MDTDRSSDPEPGAAPAHHSHRPDNPASSATPKSSTDRTGPVDATARYIEDLIARGEAVEVVEAGAPLRPGATHELLTDQDAAPAVRRRRFSAF